MRSFSISTDIQAPTDRVWDVMSDVEPWHEWTSSITSITLLDSGPFAVGSRALVRQPKLPPARWRVAAIEPGRSFEWVSAGPGFRTVGFHRVEATGEGTRAALSIEIQGVLGGVLGWLTRAITERYIGFEAAGLKARSETPAFHRVPIATP